MAVITTAPAAAPAKDLLLASTLTAPVTWGQSPNALGGAPVDRWISELGVDFDTPSCTPLRYGPLGCATEYDLTNPGPFSRMGHVCPIEVFAPYGGCTLQAVTLARLIDIRNEFARRIGSVLARALWLGDAWPASSACQYLTKVDDGTGYGPEGAAWRGLDPAVDVLAATASDALAVAIGAASLVDPGNQAMILMSPYLAGIVAGNSHVYRSSDGKLRTIVGDHIIIADPGFPTRRGPGMTTDDVAAEWIMVAPAIQTIVSPVEVAGLENLAGIQSDEALRAAIASTEATLPNRANSNVTFTLRAHAAALFGGCAVKAIRVALPGASAVAGLSSGFGGAAAPAGVAGGSFQGGVIIGAGAQTIGGSSGGQAAGGILVGPGAQTIAGVAGGSVQGGKTP